jgi:signal peptidase
MKKLKEILENKRVKLAIKIAKIMLITFIVCFFLVVCLQRFSNNKLSLFNYRMFTVISGSMRPVYNVGDVLVSKEVDPSKIKVGDTISYEGKKGGFKDKVITHEVVGISKDENGKYIFRTKGRANLVEDPPVSEDQLYGVVIYKTKMLSMIYKLIDTNFGFYMFIIIPLLFVIASEIVATLLDREEKRRSKN